MPWYKYYTAEYGAGVTDANRTGIRAAPILRRHGTENPTGGSFVRRVAGSGGATRPAGPAGPRRRPGSGAETRSSGGAEPARAAPSLRRLLGSPEPGGRGTSRRRSGPPDDPPQADSARARHFVRTIISLGESEAFSLSPSVSASRTPVPTDSSDETRRTYRAVPVKSSASTADTSVRPTGTGVRG